MSARSTFCLSLSLAILIYVRNHRVYICVCACVCVSCGTPGEPSPCLRARARRPKALLGCDRNASRRPSSSSGPGSGPARRLSHAWPATSALPRSFAPSQVQQRAAELAAASAQATDKPSALYDFDKYIGLTGAEILHQILLEREVKQVG